MSLADQNCVPCQGGVPPLHNDRVVELLDEVGGSWSLNAHGHLQSTYGFDNFMGAMGFANAIGDIAESEGHHPDLHIAWGSCRVEIWTHKINGLTESDFVLAAKIERTARVGSL